MFLNGVSLISAKKKKKKKKKKTKIANFEVNFVFCSPVKLDLPS